MTEEKFTDSESRSHLMIYQYPWNFTGTNARYGSQDLLTAHMNNVVLKESLSVGSATTRITERQYKKQTNGLLVPEWQKVYPTGGSNVLTTNFIYSDIGNIAEEKKAGGVTGDYTISYLWGYDQSLPVARIEGVSYSTVTGKFTSTELSSLYGTGLNDKERQKLLSRLQTISNALTSIYTFNPLVGITSETAPNGLITYYDYDALGRLESIKDHGSRYTDQYRYHYQGAAHP